MLLSQVLQDINVTELHAPADTEITGICYDSRQATPGCLFVAVRGFESDGHKYIASAVQKGAAAVLCEEAPSVEAPYVLTGDTRLGLALAAAAFCGYPARTLQVIGVTGTNGKTTTSFLVKQLLEQLTGEKVGLVGSIVNMIGDTELHAEHTTPESADLQFLFRDMLNAGCRYCVMEVSSHSLVLDRVAGIPFALGLFTNLTQDHLDFHKTMQAYAEAKALLFPRCRLSCANADDPWTNTVMSGVSPVYTFGITSPCTLQAEDVSLSPKGVRFTAVEGDVSCPAFLGIPGRFSVYNALSALSVCRCLGHSLPAAVAALQNCKGAKGRVEPVPTDGDYSIFIDYAVTPDAIENVLNTLRAVSERRLVMLFGCGGDRDRLKRPIMGEISGNLADFVIVTSDNPRTEDPDAIIAEILPGVQKTGKPYVVIPDRVKAIEYAIGHHEDKDVILLCGKGHEDYQIIGHTKIHMDEREIVADILRRRAAGKEQA